MDRRVSSSIGLVHRMAVEQEQVLRKLLEGSQSESSDGARVRKEHDVDEQRQVFSEIDAGEKAPCDPSLKEVLKDLTTEPRLNVKATECLALLNAVEGNRQFRYVVEVYDARLKRVCYYKECDAPFLKLLPEMQEAVLTEDAGRLMVGAKSRQE